MGSIKFKWQGDHLTFASGYALVSDGWFEVWEDNTGEGHPVRVCFGECDSKKESRRQVEHYLRGKYY